MVFQEIKPSVSESLAQVTWDYTKLARSYLKRPDYSPQVIEEVISRAELTDGDLICDIGAGVGHLTRVWHRRGFTVTALEPNDAMLKLGIEHTDKNVTWYQRAAENTGLEDNLYKLVSFGSSFNVTNRLQALRETKRILRPGGWFTCLWNHRDLSDPIQKAIEECITSQISNYQYGVRREDQSDIINESGLFKKPYYIEGSIVHQQKREDIIEAWRSHATLQRQAGDKFEEIINAISALLNQLNQASIAVPYTTRLWITQLA